MATKTKLDQVQRDVTKGGQSWDLLAVYRLRIGSAGAGWAVDVKVRVSVKLDSYANQSFARCKVWSPLAMAWNDLAEVPFGAMAGAGAGHTREPEAARALKANEDRLIALAVATLA